MANKFKKMKDDPCWKGYKMVGKKKKGAKEVPNCVPEETIHEAPRWAQDSLSKTVYKSHYDKAHEILKPIIDRKKKENGGKLKHSPEYYASTVARQVSDKVDARTLAKPYKEEVEQIDEISIGTASKVRNARMHQSIDAFKKGEFEKSSDLDKKVVKTMKHIRTKMSNGMKEETIMERGEDSKGHYRATEDGAGLTAKGAKAHGVKTAVTTPPSKLDPDGKAAKRRKSFCARMGGMKGPMKDEKGRPTRKAMSLRRWNCNEEVEQIDEVLGKDNEWGRPELRKKWAKITPGQECMSNDKIPEMDIHKGFAPEVQKEESLHEISALGAKKRAEFAAKLRKRLADPKVRAKAKQEVSHTKQAANPGAPHEHLVMQLRKASSIGSKVKFRDGGEHHVAPNHVEKFNDRYHTLKSSIEKEGLVKRAHKSHADFIRAISEDCGCEDVVQKIEPNTSGPNYPEPDEESAIEKDIMNEIESCSWEDFIDKYEDMYEDDDDDEEEELDEALSTQGRLKKKFAAIRTKAKRNLAKNLQLKRIATPDRLKKRATRSARNAVYRRLLRGRDRSSLSPAEKTRLEKMVKAWAPMVARLQVRMLQKTRQTDRQRVANKAKKK